MTYGIESIVKRPFNELPRGYLYIYQVLVVTGTKWLNRYRGICYSNVCSLMTGTLLSEPYGSDNEVRFQVQYVHKALLKTRSY